MKYRWSLAPSQPLLTGQLFRELPLSPLMAQCLVNRGVASKAEVSEFLNPRLKLLADPFLIPNMDAARSEERRGGKEGRSRLSPDQ